MDRENKYRQQDDEYLEMMKQVRGITATHPHDEVKVERIVT